MYKVAVIIASSLLLGGLARADEKPITIFSAGKTSYNLLTSRQAEIEKAVGAKLRISTPATDVGLIALSKGAADAVTTGTDFSVAIKEANKKSPDQLNPDNFVWAPIAISRVKIVVHPSNGVQSISKAQMTDILSGKIATWESISGEKRPIRVLAARNYNATTKSVAAFYLQKDTLPTAQLVVDANGLLRGIEKEPGSLAFLTQEEKLDNFKPKYLPTEIAHQSIIIVKKPLSPAMEKLVNHLKATAEAGK